MAKFQIPIVFALMLLDVLTAHAGQSIGVGFQRLDVIDPVGSGRMEATAFYPSPDDTGTTTIGPYNVDATPSVTVAVGRYPLVLISHGNLGSMWGHHDLATFLARQGNIVVSLLHPGDNFQDSSGVGAVSTIYGRPRQVSAALTAALNSHSISAHIDEARVGFVGYSAGGGTGLILAGAKPDLSRLAEYCSTRAENRNLCEGNGRIRMDIPGLEPTPDPRIRALVLMAPLSLMFDTQQLGRIAIPTRIFAAEADEELSHEENAGALAQALTSSTILTIVPDAGHFVFLAPCSEEMANSIPVICSDPPGVDRSLLHDEINDAIAEFLKSNMGPTAN